jgi:hypothetical protein
MLLGVGCASHSPLLPRYVSENTLPPAIKLTQTPFFPQTAYQCGPAALATALQSAGVSVLPQDLVGQVYVPERKGSFQVELIATARRYGIVPYPVTPTLSGLLQELHGGRPVLVMQNLGLRSLSVWHYAVVIGFDTATDQMILRSGVEANKLMKTRRFLTTWQGADKWGLVMLQPGELPAIPDRDTYVQSIAALEALGQYKAALQSYQAALQKWPADPAAMLGLGNVYYALEQLDEADAAYRKLLNIMPNHAIALNNLAQVLADRGCFKAALTTIESALTDINLDAELRSTVLRTRTAIVQNLSPGSSDSSRDCKAANHPLTWIQTMHNKNSSH